MTERTVDAMVDVADAAKWSTCSRGATVAIMLDTGDGTHLTTAFVKRGCSDPEGAAAAVRSHLCDFVAGHPRKGGLPKKFPNRLRVL